MDPCIVKKEISEIEFELKLSVDVGLERLKVIICGKTGGGSEFQSLEVIGSNKSVNSFVRLVSNLIVKRCCMFENGVFEQMMLLEGLFDYILLEQTQW